MFKFRFSIQTTLSSWIWRGRISTGLAPGTCQKIGNRCSEKFAPTHFLKAYIHSPSFITILHAKNSWIKYCKFFASVSLRIRKEPLDISWYFSGCWCEKGMTMIDRGEYNEYFNEYKTCLLENVSIYKLIEENIMNISINIRHVYWESVSIYKLIERAVVCIFGHIT